MQITLTGATGFIGRRLIDRLLSDGHSLHVLARRNPQIDSRIHFAPWDALNAEFPAEVVQRAEAIIHLAGEPVAQRWTREAKERIRRTRLDGTRRLVETLSTISHRPSVLVCASAIGYYGDRADERLTEASAPGHGFLPELCVEWEKTADLAESLGIRVVKLRIGIVLGKEGGALKQMLPPFRMGVGGRLGSGRQWMSWIHLDDLVSLIAFAATTEKLRGPVNAVAPNPETNADFTKALARTLRRPALFPVPSLVVRTLFGEMSEIVLSSQKVMPQAAVQGGFSFRYQRLAGALENLLR
jgi:uncharacterized protein (TIGR01777 family)